MSPVSKRQSFQAWLATRSRPQLASSATAWSPAEVSRKRLLGALATLALVGVDQATKSAAKAYLGPGQSRRLIRGVLGLRYVENRDGAFHALSALQSQGRDAAIVSLHLLLGAALLFFWWKTRGTTFRGQLLFALLLAGDIGNGLDRTFRGYVIDFIRVPNWPIFNLADVALSSGIVGFGIVWWRSRARNAKA